MGYELLIIGLGGALGALARFGMTRWANVAFGVDFPWGTLIINVLGSFLMGIAVALLVERVVLPPVWRSGVMIGFLGAFTTFSTYSMQGLALLEESRWLAAFGYIGGSVMLCLLAVGLGLALVRTLS